MGDERLVSIIDWLERSRGATADDSLRIANALHVARLLLAEARGFPVGAQVQVYGHERPGVIVSVREDGYVVHTPEGSLEGVPISSLTVVSDLLPRTSTKSGPPALTDERSSSAEPPAGVDAGAFEDAVRAGDWPPAVPLNPHPIKAPAPAGLVERVSGDLTLVGQRSSNLDVCGLCGWTRGTHPSLQSPHAFVPRADPRRGGSDE